MNQRADTPEADQHVNALTETWPNPLEAHGLLEQILPYLKIKRKQAKLALYVQERLMHPPE